MKKAMKSFFLMLLSMILLCGCAEKLTPRDAEAVKRKLDLLKYYDEDYMAEKTFLGVYTLGGLMKNGWTFSYSDYGSADEQALKDEYKLEVLALDVTAEHKEANYSISEGTTVIGNYALIAMVDKRLMSVYGPEEEKEDIRAFAGDLGFYKEEFAK